ncbi:DUF3597 domain-containing protein [Neorhizobium tomejilense]|uniref:DUF3597 domain-containing protein n=1 Tax=Neorhizobium tomejilense TaxID=2093828 RepID=UPI000CF996E9|nr:DUF3597 domain-containing protein [Neorhizobium tomejilense]
MSIFGRIKSAIFGHEAQAATLDNVAASGSSTNTPQITEPSATTSSTDTSSSAAVPQTAGAPLPASVQDTRPTSSVDVGAILDAAVKKSGQRLDWKHSIVDMMKALGMEASLSERKELAHELGYSGDTGDSATMNVWLHKALMQKLSDNGGKIPDELRD